jgi:RIO kinase 1
MAEEAWQNAEVDALYRLAAAGVRVPKPIICFEGVLLMEHLTDAAGNNQAGPMLERDVDNISAYLGSFAPRLAGTQYGKEIWGRYEKGLLKPDTALTGHVEPDMRRADVEAAM